MQDDDGQTIESHSISAGLDYPGVGPSTPTSPTSAGSATSPSRTAKPWRPSAALPHEGIIPAIESAHALAGAIKVGQRLAAEAGDAADKIVIVNSLGRGDKDVATAREWFNLLDKDSAEAEIAQEGEQL